MFTFYVQAWASEQDPDSHNGLSISVCSFFKGQTSLRQMRFETSFELDLSSNSQWFTVEWLLMTYNIL